MLHRRPPASQSISGPPSPTVARRTSYPVTQAASTKPNTLYAPLQYATAPIAGPTYDLGNAYDDVSSLPGSSAPFGSVNLGIARMKKGLLDALKLETSVTLIWSDPELRNTVLKLTLINILSIISLSTFDLLLVPMLSASQHSSLAERRTHVAGLLFEVLFSWPVFVICFWINSIWSPAISRRAQALSHPAYRHQPNAASASTAAAPKTLLSSLSRVAMIGDFTIVSRILTLIPVIGRLLSIAYMCIINAYYCFEYTFVSKEWPLSYRVQYMQDRAMYMLGFGLPVTLCCTFGAPLINIGVFAILYPIFVIQALHARPPSPNSEHSSSLLPSTPSPRSSRPGSPSNSISGIAFRREWRDYAKVPIFSLAIHAIDALGWLGLAVGRDRSGLAVGSRERGGKRLR